MRNRLIAHAASYALKQQWVVRNVVSLTVPPPMSRRELKPLSGSQTITFLKGAEGKRLYPLCLLAITTGMRQGEILGLQWASVRLEDGSLEVAIALKRDGLGKPKTPASCRTMLLAPEVVAALKKQRTQQVTERLLAGEAWSDSDFVFTTSLGRPMNAANLRRSFARDLKRAGLPRVRFHDLRHGTATYLLSKKRPMYEVMGLLGHSTIRVTLDFYGHLLPENQAEAVEAMSELVRSAI